MICNDAPLMDFDVIARKHVMKTKVLSSLVALSVMGIGLSVLHGCQTTTPEPTPTLAPPTEQDEKAREIIKSRPPRPPRGNKAEVGGPSER